MNLKCRLILEDYRKQRGDFIVLGDTVHTMLSDIYHFITFAHFLPAVSGLMKYAERSLKFR